MADTKELRRMANDTTPGPWAMNPECFDNDGIPESPITALDGRAVVAVTLEFGPNNPLMREANALFIAAANPSTIIELCDALDAAKAEIERLTALLNTPEIHDFGKAVVLEAAHQRERWGTDGDAGKTPADWFWLVGYLAGKALHAAISKPDKALHHVITTAAACANWHAAMLGKTNMRPGIDPAASLSTKGAESHD